jgi:hypothetical protein
MYRKDILAANRMPGWFGAAVSLYRSHFITWRDVSSENEKVCVEKRVNKWHPYIIGI